MKVTVQNRQVNVPVLPVLAGIVVITFLFMSMRLGRIDASEVGVIINNLTGNITVRMEPGSFFYNSFISDLHTIDKTENTLRMTGDNQGEVRIKTKDGADVNLDVEVNFKLLLDQKTIQTKVIPESGVDKQVPTRTSRGRRSSRPTSMFKEAYQAKWIRDYSRSVVRYVFGTLTTEEFYDATKRDEKARESERELNLLLANHGIEVTKVVPDKFRFYEEYETKIRDKKEADQEVEKQKELAKAAIEDQKRQEVEAEKRAEVEIETIKGQLEKAKIEAGALAVKDKKAADAYAYQTKVEAEAAFYQAEREAKGILATAKSEAEGLTNMVKALSGEGGALLVRRALAEALQKAQIEGLPYATSPVVQKLAIEGGLNGKGGQK